MSNTLISTESLSFLQYNPNIKNLNLSFTNVDGKICNPTYLLNMKNVVYLDLSFTKVKAIDALKLIASRKLKYEKDKNSLSGKISFYLDNLNYIGVYHIINIHNTINKLL